MNLVTVYLQKNLIPIYGSDAPEKQDGVPQGVTELEHRIEKPRLYRVLLLNDDYTPMEFVVLILKRFFAKSEEQATQIMLDVHKRGAGTAGVYTLEMAEMKVMQVNQFSRSNEHPLKCVFEPE